MKKITIAIALAAIIYMMLPTIRGLFDEAEPPQALPTVPTAVLEMGSIIVKGPGNTLASIADQIGDEGTFSYDPGRKTAICRGNVKIEGELTIGDPKGEGLTETLEFKTRVCGDCMIFVRPGGTLKAYNAEISTFDRTTIAGLCPKGYGILGEGEVVMHNVRLSYMSGSSSTIFSGRQASGVLDRVMSYGGDTNAISYNDISPGNVKITRCNFLAVGNWGAWIGRTADAPLVIDRTVFSGKSGDMLINGPADVILEDCRFRPDKVSFGPQQSSVTVRWTRCFQLIDADTRRPVAGAKVTAATRQQAGIQQTYTATTDSKGFVAFTLVEYKATPRHRTRKDGANNAAPYDINFETDNGGKATLIVDPRRAEVNHECRIVKIGSPDGTQAEAPRRPSPDFAK